MTLVNDDRAEQLNCIVEHNVFQPELTRCASVVDEIFSQALIVHYRHTEHAHFKQVGPRGARGIVEHECFLVGEFLKLALPVDFKRRGADDKGRVGVCRIYDADRLQGLSESRLVTDKQAFLLQAEEYALSLIGVRFYFKIVRKHF